MFRTAFIAAALLALAACEETTGPAVDTDADTGADAGAQTTAGVPPMPAGLNAEERVIWNSLNDQAKRQAAEFIANGGTLTQFVAV